MSASDPIVLFRDWFDAATRASIDKPNAMTLATADENGRPDARVVLLSSFDERGFVFHTNYRSRKAGQLARNPWVSLVFWWDPLGRQVRIEGRSTPTTAQESDAYFARRPRGSQLGAWASNQSEMIEGRAVLEARVQELTRVYAGKPVPRPPHWGGYRVAPQVIEFWQDRDDRLHDRTRYERESADTWRIVIVAP